jgi:protein subunit release factor A
MLNKLEAIKARFDQVGVALTNPEIINNQKEFGVYSKEYRSLEKIVQPYEAYIKVLADHQYSLNYSYLKTLKTIKTPSSKFVLEQVEMKPVCLLVIYWACI